MFKKLLVTVVPLVCVVSDGLILRWHLLHQGLFDDEGIILNIVVDPIVNMGIQCL